MAPIRFRTFALAAAMLAATPLAAAAGETYGDQNAQEVCGFLPYRPIGPDRFAAPRPEADRPARIGAQTAYPFAWDLARPGFHAAEVAEDIIDGRPLEAVRDVHGGPLSLGEYMLHAARKFEARPETPETDDVRVALAAERPLTFHLIYLHSKQSYDAVVALLEPDAGTPDPATLSTAAASWRPAYALVAKAQADDKRIELLDSHLDADAIAEKEAVACLAHAVAALAEDASATARAKASAARWESRPVVNIRKVGRGLRTVIFEYEDAGDDLADAISGLPDGPADLDAMRPVAKAYADFVGAAKALYEARKQAGN